MGYTHYFYTKPTLDAGQFKLLAKDVKKLLKGDDNILCFEYDKPKQKPQVTDELIRFNGKLEDGHETFYLSRITPVSDYCSNKEMAFAFCKTAHKPYDVYVTAVLILAKNRLGSDIRVSSDGQLVDWNAGQQLVEKVFNCELTLAMTDKDGVVILNSIAK